MTDPKAGWHLEKSVSLSHILTTIALVVSGLTWAMSIDKRVDANAIVNEHQTKRLDEFKTDLKSDIDQINSKLDKILDRELNR